MMRSRLGQTILEYTMIIGILTVVLYYMGTSIKRGVQSLVKITADQVGNQENADQDFNDTQIGYMDSSNTHMGEDKFKQTTEVGYISNITNSAVYFTKTTYNESTDEISNTITNGGFTPSS